jgi:hypothetical protein
MSGWNPLNSILDFTAPDPFWDALPIDSKKTRILPIILNHPCGLGSELDFIDTKIVVLFRSSI